MADEDTTEEVVEDKAEETPDERDARIKELEGEVQKLKDKEMNFEKLRDKGKKAEKEIQEKETEMEKLKREQDEFREQETEKNRKWREDQFQDQKEQYFKAVYGDDKDTLDKVNLEAENLKGETNTFAQWKAKMEKAHLLVKGSRPSPSVFGKVGLTSTPPETGGKKSFADTTEGQTVLDKVTRGSVDWSKQPKRTKGGYFDN